MADISFDKFMEQLSLLIKQRRKELGLTQGDVGDRLGKPQSTIARFESGSVKDPHISLVFEVCEALGIRPGDLFNEVFEKAGQGKVSKKEIERKLKALSDKMDQLDAGQKELVTSIIDGVMRLV
ncbi:MAG: helix-turn-helix domain-containing protein [Oligoflexus sp.]